MIFPINFNIRDFMSPKGDKPEWMVKYTISVTKDDKRGPGYSLEYQTVKDRIRSTYDIELTKFKDTNPHSLTRGQLAKIGTRDRRMEHIVLTSPDTLIRDALTFVFMRTHVNVLKKRPKKKTDGREEGD